MNLYKFCINSAKQNMYWILNLFQWNLLKINGAKINQPKVYKTMSFLKFDVLKLLKKMSVITVLRVSFSQWVLISQLCLLLEEIENLYYLS